MNTKRQKEIFWVIFENQPIGIADILEKITDEISISTLNRELSTLKKEDFLQLQGKGPNTKYKVNLKGLVQAEIDPELFFKTEIDSRKIIEKYNSAIFETLKDVVIFSEKELNELDNFTKVYREKIHALSESNYKKEFERLMIELSWKSSQIEGNTYDLLDTEQLLKYNILSKKHSFEEANMLLNHKVAIEYTRENADLFEELSLGKIIDIHTLLTRELGILKTIRNRIVRITGTKYTPPDNQFLIEESLEELCKLVNSRKNIYEKALLSQLLLSYIQPFDDGNKRTARLVSNALLMAADMSPLSYRSVSPIDYKKAILLFYELNNINAFKKIFVSQYKFAVENYF